MTLEWLRDPYDSLVAKVPWVVSGMRGTYEIIIVRRPHYCDRGDWLIHVAASDMQLSGLDGSDGFPRYFFGTEAEVKAQMETWASRRENAAL